MILRKKCFIKLINDKQNKVESERERVEQKNILGKQKKMENY